MDDSVPMGEEERKVLILSWRASSGLSEDQMGKTEAHLCSSQSLPVLESSWVAFPAPNPKLPRPKGWVALSSLDNTAILATWPFSPLTHLAAAPGSLSPFPTPGLLAWFGSASPVHSERLQMPLPLFSSSYL